MEENMDTGALKDFIALFENPKQGKQSDSWRRFFLSEAFLGEQFKEEFVEGMLAYLTRQQVYPWDNLPAGFLMELAIAYAVTPHFAGEEYFDGLRYPKEWYKVSTEHEDWFPAERYVAEIFNMQGRECDLKSMTRRMLHQPGNKVRHNASSDYLTLKEMGRQGRLTEDESEIWQGILNKCQVHYLYERNGKRPGLGDYESRSECVVKLYVQWLKDERLPECVLKFFYKRLDFKELDRSSTKGLYGALKEQVLRQLPQMEELLFGEDGKEQAIVKVYRACAGIINDHQTNYEHSVYGETQEISKRIRELFAMPQWEMLKGDRTFFDRLYFAAKRLVMPPSLTHGLIEYLACGNFPEPKRTELAESLLRSLSTGRSCKEMDYLHEVEFRDEDFTELKQNENFWQYYLMRGFGYRRKKLRGDWEADYIYEAGGYCYLPGYIRYIYDPSRAWQRRFVGFDEEEERMDSPVSRQCAMPDGRRLKVEFHYHYCLYFVDGVLAPAPVMGFEELAGYAGGPERERDLSPLEFFFLLAVTAIEAGEQQEAEELIGTWLKRIPVYPQICPLIAGLLAADNDPLPGDARAVYYMEQERFCFRAVVGENSVRVFKQTDFGWEDINYRQTEFGWKWVDLPPYLSARAEEFISGDREEGERIALEILEGLRQPKPVLQKSRVVAGMNGAEKTTAILETMGYFDKEESYCVLRYGDQRKRRHDRVFYGAKVPFGFPIRAQSTEHERWVNYLMSVCSSKIKERKRLVARFGWGFKYNHKSDFWPVCVYEGESGTYYAYGAIKMHRAGTLAELLADLLSTELEGVTEAESYEGCLTVSRFDHRLEYCYGEREWLLAIHGEEGGQADFFTVFGRTMLWKEFAQQLDLFCGEEMPWWVNVIILGLDPALGGMLTLKGIHVDEEPIELEGGWEDFGLFEEEGDAPCRDGEFGFHGSGKFGDRKDYGMYCPQIPTLVWEKGLDINSRMDSLKEAVRWYLDETPGGQRLKEKGIRLEVE